LGFVDVEKPSNVDAVFEMFNSNFLSLVPNPFGNEDYNDDYEGGGDAPAPQTRIIADSSLIAERKCPPNNVMRTNEFSCYFLNSSGQHIIHGFIYIIFKVLLIFLIHCMCHNRIKKIEMDMHIEKMEQEKKLNQKNSPGSLEKKSKKKLAKKNLQKSNSESNLEAKDEDQQRQVIEQQQEKQTMGYRFMRLMFKLNMRVNIKFFFTVLSIFQLEFLLSAFANFRFLKANSTFGVVSMACSILVLALALFVIGISAWKMNLIRVVKQESYELKIRTYLATKETISVRKDLE